MLDRDDRGGLARDPLARGRIAIIDSSALNGPGAFQVRFENSNGFFNNVEPSFSVSSTVLSFAVPGGRLTFVRRIGG